MADTAEFTVTTDQIEFRTKTNGDRVDMRGMHIGSETAAKLARLVNLNVDLHIEIKEYTP